MAESKKKPTSRKIRSSAAAATTRRNGKAKIEAALGADQPIETAAKPRRTRSKKLPAGLSTTPIESQEVDSLSI
ncbi:MAG: hypothetical protein HY870_20360, partial [Chloroflexi bacterium]|nr:hypothetical protein [Chloroflexota bacterium]